MTCAERVHDGHLVAAPGQAAGGFEAEQAAAEHRDRRAEPGGVEDLGAVVEAAEGDHAGPGFEAFDRRDPRVGAGGEHQRVVVHVDPSPSSTQRFSRSMRGDVDAEPQVDVVPRGPFVVVQADALGAHPAGDDGGQQHPVVGGVLLGAEHGQPDALGDRVAAADLVGQPGAGHAVPDDDDFTGLMRHHPQ